MSAFCCAKLLSASLVRRVLKRPHEQVCEPAESAGAKRSRREFESLIGLIRPLHPRKLKYIGKKMIKYIKIDFKSQVVLLGSLSVAGFSKLECEGGDGLRNKEPKRHWGGGRPFCRKQNS